MSPGPELSPLEPGLSPLAVVVGPGRAAIPSKTCLLRSLCVLPSGVASGLGHCRRRAKYCGAQKSRGAWGLLAQIPENLGQRERAVHAGLHRR